MGEQLKTLPLYKEDSHIYLADGIIKLNGVKNIKILLLETLSCFGSIDRSKIAFDHHKGLFGALAMLKSIADEFPMASMEAFQKCKVFFVHGAGKIQISFAYFFFFLLCLLSYLITFRKKPSSLELTFRARRPRL